MTRGAVTVDEWVELVRSRARQVACAQAEFLVALAQAAGGLAGGDDPDSVQEASLELGWVLCWSEGYAWSQVEFGRDLVGRLPMVLAALRAGGIDRDRAWAFVDALRCIGSRGAARRVLAAGAARRPLCLRRSAATASGPGRPAG